MFFPTTLASFSSGVMFNCSTTLRDSATNIEKISWKSAPEREQPNSSVVKMVNLRSPLSQLLGQIEVCVHWVFCRCNFAKFLFEVFFDIICIFMQRSTLKWTYFFYSQCVIILIFKNDTSLEPLASFLRKIEMCVYWVFWGKFNSAKLLFQAFFDIIGICLSIRL